MKKILLIAVALMLVPFAAMATMTAISDTDMAQVTGQAGVTLAPIDVSLDLTIENISYKDNDGYNNVAFAGVPHGNAAGVFSIKDFGIKNLHMTLNGTPVSTLADVEAKGLEIDIATFGSAEPFLALRDKTAVVIGMPDMYMTIDEIAIGAMTLGSSENSVTSTWYGLNTTSDPDRTTLAGHYEFTSDEPDGGSFGDIKIQGITLVTYAYPRTVSGTVGSATYSEYNLSTTGEANNPANRAVVIIMPH